LSEEKNKESPTTPAELTLRSEKSAPHKGTPETNDLFPATGYASPSKGAEKRIKKLAPGETGASEKRF